MSEAFLRTLVRDVPDFPIPGILFKDITPVLQDPEGLRVSIGMFVDRWRALGVQRVVGIESRGFLFGAAVARDLGVGFAAVRKKGKLPYETVEQSYALEYGEATLAMHVDSIAPGQKVAIVDDLLATGGTLLATVDLVRRLGGVVLEAGCLIELSFLPGREKLAAGGVDFWAPLVY